MPRAIYRSWPKKTSNSDGSQAWHATEVSGLGALLGWHDNPWHCQASYQRYDYEKDLSALSRSRFARSIVKSSTLAQSSLLRSQYASLLLGHEDYDNDYSLRISQAQSAIDESYAETLMLSWQHWTSPRFGYFLAAATALAARRQRWFDVGPAMDAVTPWIGQTGRPWIYFFATRSKRHT